MNTPFSSGVHSLDIMIGARYVCLSLSPDTEIHYTPYEVFPADTSWECYYATNVKTFYRKTGDTDWIPYGVEPIAPSTSALGRPLAKFTTSITDYNIALPYTRVPHWFRNRWRWTIDCFEPSSSYDILVYIMADAKSSLRVRQYVFTAVHTEAEGNVLNNVSSLGDRTVLPDIEITTKILNGTGMKFTGKELDSNGIKWLSDVSVGGAGEARLYTSISIGSTPWVGVKSNFAIILHELAHYFGVGGLDKKTEPRIGLFHNPNNYIEVSKSADPIAAGYDSSRIYRDDTGHTSTWYYYYAKDDDHLSYVEEVYQYMLGKPDGHTAESYTSPNLVRHLDHTHLPERKTLEDFFMLRALAFEHVYIATNDGSGTATSDVGPEPVTPQPQPTPTPPTPTPPAPSDYGFLTLYSSGTSTLYLYNFGDNNPDCHYCLSTDGGASFDSWNTMPTDGEHKVSFQTIKIWGEGTSFSVSSAQYSTFVIEGDNVRAAGSVMSLVAPDGVMPITIPCDWCFYRLFYGMDEIVTGQGTIWSTPQLPAVTLKPHCYDSMFCSTNLQIAPDLPATTLADGCYQGMFAYCRNLDTTGYRLPATTLAEHCYHSMFYNCTGMTLPPNLPAETLAEACYFAMFKGCKSLSYGIELPATNTENCADCYGEMFKDCTGFQGSVFTIKSTTSPADYEFARGMFEGSGTEGYIDVAANEDAWKNADYTGIDTNVWKVESIN